MGRRKRSKDKAGQRPAPGSTPDSRSPKRGNGRTAAPSWAQTHGRDLRFLLIFGALMGLYYVITTTQPVKAQFFPWYLQKTTDVSGALLHASGYDGVTVNGNALVADSGRSVIVERGCDAIAPTALFLSAVIASPAPWSYKLIAVFGGTMILMVVNLLRIISLFLTRIHWPKAFDVMHLDIWQAVFIFLAIFLWAVWASWTTRHRKAKALSHATA